MRFNMAEKMPAGERFKVGSLIGKGSCGEVHRGVDTQTGETVAVKLIDLEATDDEVEDIQKVCVAFLKQNNFDPWRQGYLFLAAMVLFV